MARPPIVCVCGKKNSGKTTLLEKLIAALTRRGLAVATIKHDRHGFDIDHEGKDTWRHKRAGAVATLISGPDRIGLVRDLPDGEMSLEQICGLLGDGIELVLAEGFKRSALPKVEVVRAERSREAICGPDDQLLALVTDVEGLDLGVPRFGLDEVEPLADLLAARAGERG